VRWLIRLYPRAWRERYGAELEALLEDAPPGVRDVADLIWSALLLRLRWLPLWAGVGLLCGFGLTFLLPPQRVTLYAVIFESPKDSGQLKRSIDSSLRKSWPTLYHHVLRDIQVHEIGRSIAIFTYPPVASRELVDRLADQVRAELPSPVAPRSGVMRAFNAPVRPYPILLPLMGMGGGILLGLLYRLNASPLAP
jgi:hypothetical protein